MYSRCSVTSQPLPSLEEGPAAQLAVWGRHYTGVHPHPLAFLLSQPLCHNLGGLSRTAHSSRYASTLVNMTMTIAPAPSSVCYCNLATQASKHLWSQNMRSGLTAWDKLQLRAHAVQVASASLGSRDAFSRVQQACQAQLNAHPAFYHHWEQVSAWPGAPTL